MATASDRTVTVHIEDVPLSSITTALIAIELCDERGIWNPETHDELTRLVIGLRDASDRGYGLKP